MNAVVAGIDIGGTNTTIGLVDASGKVLVRTGLKTRDFPEPEGFVKTACEVIMSQLAGVQAQYPDMQLKGIGIGAPNANPFRGTIEYAPNLSWKGIVPLAALFGGQLKVPCELTNDAKAATLGEQQFGGAKGMKDFMVITLGTGLGGGIVANGELVYGHDGFAGELGHVIMVPENGRLCGCGRKGCLETYCSATGLVATYLELNPSAPPDIQAREIAERAVAGEPEAIKAYRITGEMLGLALANSVVYTSPQAIFLFGGLIRAGELLFAPIRESFERNLLINYRGHITINPSALHESDAAILGAASLIWRKK